jgi:hypothetical protein
MIGLVFGTTNKKTYMYKQPDEVAGSDTYILGDFLTSSVGHYPKNFKNWMLNNESDSTAGNSTFLDKKNSYIVLRDRSPHYRGGGPEVFIPRAEMIRLLDWWTELLKHKPEEVKLIFDGKRFIFDPQYGI